MRKACVLAMLAVAAMAQEPEKFYSAIRENNLTQLKALLEGPTAKADVPDNHGITPLMYAAEIGSLDAMRVLIDRGADVLYAERQGVSDAAKERGKLSFGNVIDTQKDYPSTVVACAVWDMAPTVEAAIAKVKAKNFSAEDYGKYSGLAFKGSYLSPLGSFEGKVPPELVTKVTAAQKDILEGKLKVKVTDTEPKSTV